MLTQRRQQEANGCAARPTTVFDRLRPDLRRTMRTKLSALRCNYKTAEAIIGHLPIGDDSVYDRHTYGAARQWLTKVAEHREMLAKQ